MTYETFTVKIENHIAHVAINRPEKANSMNQKAWEEMGNIFNMLDTKEDVRVIILSGEGKHFCAGIDLNLLMSIPQMIDSECEGRKREKLRKIIQDCQSTVNAIENCSKPVLAAIQKGCIGGGLDIAVACDMRYASEDAYFSVKEVEMGMVADLGTLQRLPKIVPYAIACEMAYTGKNISAKEAKTIHLVNETFETQEALLEGIQKIAETIASNAPLAVRGTKHILKHARAHSVQEGLNYMATWNSAMLMSKDLMDSFEAKMMGKKADYLD